MNEIELELEDVTKILDKDWLEENVGLFKISSEPQHVKISEDVIWYYFDEFNFEIKKLVFNTVKLYSFYIGEPAYSFGINYHGIGSGFSTFAPTITELKKKLLIKVRNRIDEINIERTELLERMENICEL